MNKKLVIGKYTLESLTNGMYSSPLDLYREYVQNAVDSLDDAIRMGLIDKLNARIDIFVNTNTQSICIRDNGCGISSKNAEHLLVDIGNSKKHRVISRGFRGIGRLAGLGYCDSLTFITSVYGESEKTVITFDAKKLKKLLLPGASDNDSIYDVIDAIVTKDICPEKESTHYFEVVLNGISHQNSLIEYDVLNEYLIQNLPLPFHPDFKWGQTILSKTEINGYIIPAYNVFLNYNTKEIQLFKPYRDTIVSDRVKKIEDSVHDIQIKLLGDKQSPLGIMWYASTDFFGTIIDSTVKGLRLRQGNILIGDNSTCSHFFKEERFNGWVAGEVHILHNDLVPNSRRDNFEQNDSYYLLTEEITSCASAITKELRKLSYDRNLSNEKKAVVQAETIDDINSLCIEDLDLGTEVDEFTLMNLSDGDLEAENDFIEKLSMIISKKGKQTKYTALNINDRLTNEQRRILERVFDLICEQYSDVEAKRFINTIASKF